MDIEFHRNYNLIHGFSGSSKNEYDGMNKFANQTQQSQIFMNIANMEFLESVPFAVHLTLNKNY